MDYFRIVLIHECGADPFTHVFENRAHNFYTIEYVCSGYGNLHINEQTFKAKPDDIYILPKHSNNRYFQDNSNPWKKFLSM